MQNFINTLWITGIIAFFGFVLGALFSNGADSIGYTIMWASAATGMAAFPLAMGLTEHSDHHHSH